MQMKVAHVDGQLAALADAVDDLEDIENVGIAERLPLAPVVGLSRHGRPRAVYGMNLSRRKLSKMRMNISSLST